jgi:hypothetical protein
LGDAQTGDLSEDRCSSINDTFREWMVVSRKKKPTAPRKPFHAGGKGYENSIIAKSNNNGGHVSNPVAEAEHKEGKRKSPIPIEKVSIPTILSNSGQRRKGKDKGKGMLGNSKNSSSKKLSVPNVLFDEQLGKSHKASSSL